MDGKPEEQRVEAHLPNGRCLEDPVDNEKDKVADLGHSQRWKLVFKRLL